MIAWLLDIFASKWRIHYTADGVIMRRHVNGAWETKPMTEDEEAEALWAWAIR
jgi:hypothetical protein